MRKALMGLAGLVLLAAFVALAFGHALAARTVSYGHVQVELPPGWKSDVANPCSPQPDTVAVWNGRTTWIGCNLTGAPRKQVRTVYVAPLYDSKTAASWVGAPTNWEGQHAWLFESSAPAGGRAAAQLMLPWLNARVVAVARDATTARALLNNVQVRPGTTLEVPASGDSVTVQQSKAPPLKTSKQAVINMLLSDLRQLKIVQPSATCTKVMKSGPKDYWTITFTTAGESTVFMLPMNGCKQVTSGTGVVGLTNHKFWLDFNKYFETRPFATPLCCAPAPTVAPKTSFYFTGDSYIYPAPGGSLPKFTHEQFIRALPAHVGRNAGTPEVYLVMSKGPGRGPTAPTLLMWVARYNKALMPGHFCRAVLPNGKPDRCPIDVNDAHVNSFVFYDANSGLFDMTFQIDGSKVAPGHLTINQWAALYKAARG